MGESDDDNLQPLQDKPNETPPESAKKQSPNPDEPAPIMKKVPVCGCGEERAECKVCGKGFLELVQKGEIPLFKDIVIPTKRIAVCDCGEHRAECANCNAGYMTTMLKGITPKFKVVPVEPSDKSESGPIDMKKVQMFHVPSQAQSFKPHLGHQRFNFIHNNKV